MYSIVQGVAIRRSATNCHTKGHLTVLWHSPITSVIANVPNQKSIIGYTLGNILDTNFEWLRFSS